MNGWEEKINVITRARLGSQEVVGLIAHSWLGMLGDAWGLMAFGARMCQRFSFGQRIAPLTVPPYDGAPYHLAR